MPDFLLWCPPKSRTGIMAPTLSHSLVSLKTNLHLISKWHPLSHLFCNPLFLPGMDIKAFSPWLNKGMYRIGHFIHPTGPITLAYYISKLQKALIREFHLRQIKHFLHKLWTCKPDPLTFTNYELWCGQAMEQRGGISVIYRSLDEMESKTFIHA